MTLSSHDAMKPACHAKALRNQTARLTPRVHCAKRVYHKPKADERLTGGKKHSWICSAEREWVVRFCRKVVFSRVLSSISH